MQKEERGTLIVRGDFRHGNHNLRFHPGIVSRDGVREELLTWPPNTCITLLEDPGIKTSIDGLRVCQSGRIEAVLLKIIMLCGN